MGVLRGRRFTVGMTQNRAGEERAGDMTVLVTGATGRTGRRVAEAARAAGLEGAGGVPCGRGSTGLPVDVGGRDACRVPTPAYRPPHGCRLADAAEVVGGRHGGCWSGVRRRRRAVLAGEERARPAEEALRASGADWTVVRAAWFAQNFSEGPLVEGLLRGELCFPPVRCGSRSSMCGTSRTSWWPCSRGATGMSGRSSPSPAPGC